MVPAGVRGGDQAQGELHPLALDGEEDRPVLAGGFPELLVQRFAPKADGTRDVPHAPDDGTHFQHFLFLRSKKERRCARLALVKQKQTQEKQI